MAMSLGNKVITSVVTCWIISTVCMTSISAFTIHTATPFATKSPISSSTSLFAKEKNKVSIDLTNIPERGSGNLLEKFFTGGAFEDDSATNLAEAVKIASRIKSAKDLGWTKPPKRRGNTKPRHRAWGGESELSVQDKPNYDETKEKCVEKWLTLVSYILYRRVNYRIFCLSELVFIFIELVVCLLPETDYVKFPADDRNCLSTKQLTWSTKSKIMERTSVSILGPFFRRISRLKKTTVLRTIDLFF